jgi:hypothetical protein
MAVELKFVIDGLDRGQPLNPEEFAITINTEDSIGARVVSFGNDLIFGGDVYDYLYTKLEVSGYCELVRLSVQYKCAAGTWEPLVDGYIIVTECLFLLDKCEVKTKMYDETFSTKINNNKSIPFSLDLTTTKNGQPIVPPTLRRLEIFNPATGIFEILCAYGYPVYDVFKHLIGCMSDNLVDFESNYFKVVKPDFNVPAYTVGKSLRTRTIQQTSATFESLYAAMRSKLNLGMGFEKQANGRPLLRIEPIAYFQQSNPSANLYDQPGIEMSFDRTMLYQAVDFGNEVVLEAQECDGGNTPCTFTQTPFRGFRNETFGFVGECNTSAKLNLQTPAIIFDANAIEDVIRFAVEDYDNDNFIIQTRFLDFGPNPDVLLAQQYDPYGLGQAIYNGNFANNVVSSNWLSGYPNSLYSFLEEPWNPIDTQFFCEMTFFNNPTQDFEVNWPAYTSFTSWNGVFPQWLEINDNGNNFNSTTYTVPYTGVYTFSCQFVLSFFPKIWESYCYAVIEHYDSGGTLIQAYDGTVSFKQASVLSAGILVPFVSETFICNQGDLVRTNVYASANDTTTFPNPTNVTLIRQWTDTLNNITYDSYFIGGGVPFVPLELEAIDINDVKAYTYKFDRPLSMQEINAITSEPSKPIMLGRKDDPVATIPTYIQNINIQSVMRKNTQFELRSNKLLP